MAATSRPRLANFNPRPTQIRGADGCIFANRRFPIARSVSFPQLPSKRAPPRLAGARQINAKFQIGGVGNAQRPTGGNLQNERTQLRIVCGRIIR
ncbi:MAG: hypothetical protein H0T51_23410 [Pirellulales bacterium]|nr:hypothetical protein [Pirellulales bacterium]